jgi:hypothetical protein
MCIETCAHAMGSSAVEFKTSDSSHMERPSWSFDSVFP